MTITGQARPRQVLDDPRSAGNGQPFFGEDGFTFGDIVDMVNPLQHIPVLNGIYRHFTGDEISMGSRLAGGAIFGGAIGFVSAMANSMIEDVTGKDVGEHVVAMFTSGENEAAPDAITAPRRALAQTDQPSAPIENSDVSADDMRSALLAMASSRPGTPAAALPLSTPQEPMSEAGPAYLAALPSRQAIAAGRAAAMQINATSLDPSPMEQSSQAARGASGTVPSLSPAAMTALMAALSGGAISPNDNDDKDDDHIQSAPNLGDDPASMAAWQAAMAARMAATH